MTDHYRAAVGEVATALEQPVADPSVFIPARDQWGRKAHFNYFDQQPEILTEIGISGCYRSPEGISLQLRGRIDGLDETSSKPVVIEFKTVVLAPGELAYRTDFPPPRFALQAKIYAYLWAQKLSLSHAQSSAVSCRVLIENLTDHKIAAYPVKWTIVEVERLLEEFLNLKIHEQAIRRATRDRRQQIARKMKWFYPSYRSDQESVIELIQEVLVRDENLLFEAPTGYGKTAVVIYAALKQALANGRQVFFATAKGGGRLPIINAVQELQQQCPSLKVLILAARTDLCPLTGAAGDCADCHQRRIEPDESGRAELPAELLTRSLLTPEFIKAVAADAETCPVDLSQAMLDRVDLIIGDYNYVFDPQIKLFQFRNPDRHQKLPFTLLIDEVHNLVTRGREMFSVALNQTELRQTSDQLEAESWRFTENRVFNQLAAFYRDYVSFIEHTLAQGSPAGPVEFEIDETEWADYYHKFADLLAELYISEPGRIEPELSFALTRDFNDLKFFNELMPCDRDAFPQYIDVLPGEIGIKCLDAQTQLGEVYQHFSGVVAFSGTLTPSDFYRSALGLGDQPCRVYKAQTTFDRDHLRVLLAPAVDTRFRHREREAQKIAEVITKFVDLKRGGYLIVFPSFEFLELVRDRLELAIPDLLSQRRRMSESERDQVHRALRRSDQTTVALVVAGGQFSEAADYPGDACVGVVIAGPCLPPPDAWREAYRHYWSRQDFDGEQVAYIRPGLRRVQQAAGRMIRSESDRGVVLLLDDRFLKERFFKLLPPAWQEDLAASGPDWVSRVENFWD